MGAPDVFRRRAVVVLTTGVVISLTALTGGLAPAVAKPGHDDDVVTTTVVPEPEPTVPEAEVTAEPTATASEPVVPQAPSSQPATEVAPQTQAPTVEPEPEAEPEPQTQAPTPPKTSTAVHTAAPSAEPSTTVERSPVRSPASSATSPAPSLASQAPATTATGSQSARASTSSSSAASPSASPRPTSGTSQAPGASRSAASATEVTNNADESDTPTGSISQAAEEIETLAPKTLEAPAADIQLAKSSKPVFEEQPAPAAQHDVTEFSNAIESSLKIPGLDIGATAKNEVDPVNGDVQLVSQVRQWSPDWIQYDEFYRPVILNPFRDPVRLVYMYDLAPRIVMIPPLAQMVLEVAQFAAYSFTAAVLSPINAAIDTMQTLTDIAVGSFFGGGFFPGVGLPLPPAPPPVLRYDNVPVLVRYSDATYEPFRVRQIIDAGDDPVYGERKVLLDGATPAWGVWTQTATGERQFEVHRTQQFPGLDAPQQGPLPGDYRLRLVADDQSTGGLTGRDIFLMVAAGVIGTLGFGAIGLAIFLGRRRPEH
jgi:hypothetical protein